METSQIVLANKAFNLMVGYEVLCLLALNAFNLVPFLKLDRVFGVTEYLYSNITLERNQDYIVERQNLQISNDSCVQFGLTVHPYWQRNQLCFERVISNYIVEETYSRFVGEHLSFQCPTVEYKFRDYAANVTISKTKGNGTVINYYTSKLDFPSMTKDDFGQYECIVCFICEEKERLCSKYSIHNVKEDKLLTSRIHPYPSSFFQLNFSPIHTHLNINPDNISHYVNGRNIKSIDQGLMLGCSFIPLSLSNYCDIRRISITKQGDDLPLWSIKTWLCYNSFIGGNHELNISTSKDQIISLKFIVLPQTFIYDTHLLELSDSMQSYLVLVGKVVFHVKMSFETILFIVYLYIIDSLFGHIIDKLIRNQLLELLAMLRKSINDDSRQGQRYHTMVLNVEENRNAANEMVSMIEHWGRVCYAERDLAHEGNLPVQDSLYKALRRCNNLVIILSKEFLEEPHMLFFLTYQLKDRFNEYFTPRNVLFCETDNSALSIDLRSCFSDSVFTKWRNLKRSEKKYLMLNVTLDKVLIDYIRALAMLVLLFLFFVGTNSLPSEPCKFPFNFLDIKLILSVFLLLIAIMIICPLFLFLCVNIDNLILYIRTIIGLYVSVFIALQYQMTFIDIYSFFVHGIL